jgi:hypothetical protein
MAWVSRTPRLSWGFVVEAMGFIPTTSVSAPEGHMSHRARFFGRPGLVPYYRLELPHGGLLRVDGPLAPGFGQACLPGSR